MDIVTETDQGVERMVSARLSQAFPEFSFMGEETYKPGMRVGPEPTFIVDPIDGKPVHIIIKAVKAHMFGLTVWSTPYPISQVPQTLSIHSPTPASL